MGDNAPSTGQAQGDKWPIDLFLGSLISSSHLSASGCQGQPSLIMALILAEPDFPQSLFPGEEQPLVSPEPFCHGGGSAEPEL